MLSKYLASSLGSLLYRPATDAATLSLPFPRIILLKLTLFSTFTVGNGRLTSYPEAGNICPVSKFLLNECGLRQSDLSTIFKKFPSMVRRKSTDTPLEVVRLLRDAGLTEHQVRTAITRAPSILFINAGRLLKPKIELMKTLGFTIEDLGKIISGQPRVICCNLEKTLSPNIQYLHNLLGSEADVYKVLKKAPEILVNSKGPEFLEKKLKHFTSFGLLDDEIKEIFMKSPRMLTVSMDKVQKNMDFFIHTVGLPAKFLVTYPTSLGYSLECRIKPRYEVFKSIKALQPSKCSLSFPVVLTLSERDFLESYMKCGPHATKLLEIYSGKPVDLDIVQ